MKCVAALSLTLASMVQAHYTFPYYITPSGNVTGQWEYVRETANHYSNGPVTDVNSTAIACYQLTSGDEGAETASVQAGGSYTSSSGDSCQFPGCYTGYEAGILFDIYVSLRLFHFFTFFSFFLFFFSFSIFIIPPLCCNNFGTLRQSTLGTSIMADLIPGGTTLGSSASVDH